MSRRRADANVAVPELLERVARIEDERAVLRVLYRFAHCIDYGLQREFVELFTDDGVFEVVRRQGLPTVRRSGREELMRFIAAHTSAPDYFHKHLIFNPLVVIKGDTANVESYFALLDEHHGGPYVKTYGRYRDTLARDSEGWRLRLRRAEVEVRTPDYVFGGEASGMLPERRTPDRG